MLIADIRNAGHAGSDQRSDAQGNDEVRRLHAEHAARLDRWRTSFEALQASCTAMQDRYRTEIGRLDADRTALQAETVNLRAVLSEAQGDLERTREALVAARLGATLAEERAHAAQGQLDLVVCGAARRVVVLRARIARIDDTLQTFAQLEQPEGSIPVCGTSHLGNDAVADDVERGDGRHLGRSPAMVGEPAPHL